MVDRDCSGRGGEGRGGGVVCGIDAITNAQNMAGVSLVLLGEKSAHLTLAVVERSVRFGCFSMHACMHGWTLVV